MNVRIRSSRKQHGLPDFFSIRTVTIERAIEYALLTVFKVVEIERSIGNGPLYFSALVNLPHLLDFDEFLFENEQDRMKLLLALADHMFAGAKRLAEHAH